MRNTKIIRVLKLLDENELIKFKDFVNSPYFNKNKRCAELLEFIDQFKPDYTNPKLDDCQKALKFPSKDALNTTKSRLFYLLEDFFSFEAYSKKEVLQQYFLLESLRAKKESALYQKNYDKAIKIINKQALNSSNLHSKYLIELSRFEQMFDERKPFNETFEQIQKIIIAYCDYTFCNFLWLDNLYNNEKRITSINELKNPIVGNLDKVIDVFDSYSDHSKNPLIDSEWLLNQLLKSEGARAFEDLIEHLEKNFMDIDRLTHRYFYIFLSNFCIKKIIEGKNGYYKKLLRVYMFGIETGIIIDDKGYLSPTQLKNIVITCIKAENPSLVPNLLDKYIPLVYANHQALTKNYCYGYWHYHLEEYELAISFFQACKKDKGIMVLNAESILFKIYYETNEDIEFDIPVRVFEAKLKRYLDREPKSIIHSYLNFFRILKQIFRKKSNPNFKKSFGELKNLVGKTSPLSDKQWLLEKIKELEA